MLEMMVISERMGKPTPEYNRWAGTAEAVASFFQHSFPRTKLILVSNREPYIHVRTRSGEKIREPIGGLTKALDPVIRAVGGTWVAWGSGNTDRDYSDKCDRERVPPFNPSYQLRRVWMEDSEVRGYYYGFSNQVLWPLHHNMLEKVRLRRWFWSSYERINRRFAQTVLEEINGKPAIVWLHDYHLAVCPQAIRQKLPSAKLAQFWHIPWVGAEVLKAVPQATQLLEGLLANDLLSFHTQQFCDNFMHACDRMLNCRVDIDNGEVLFKDHICNLIPVPISIDFDDLESYALSERSKRFIDRFVEKYNLRGKSVAISVDRIDYTKGLLEKLDALDLFFRKYADWKRRLSLVMVSASSRDNIRAYSELKSRLMRKILRLNEVHGDGDWQPVIFTGALDKWSLIPLYKLSDLAIVSSLKDGMNLVAKEYIACQVNENGVLLLSEFAGAAEEIQNAVQVNPYDTEGFADKILQALRMTRAERVYKMKRLRSNLREHNIYHWMSKLLSKLKSVVHNP
jgi:trehalose-6-phosphate synthase